MALGRHHAFFGQSEWPNEISLMASRKWTNIHIKDLHYEVQTSFFSDNLSELDHLTACVFIKLFDENTFIQWVSEVCKLLVTDSLTENWMSSQTFNQQLNEQLKMRIKAVWTLPSDEPGPADHTSFHIGMIICLNN